MAYDRNLLAFKDIEAFKLWLDENKLAWRPGKGQHQALQVQLKDGWPAVCVSERGAVTTAPAMREMIARFNKGLPYTGKTPRIDQDKAEQLAPDQLLEDLRDDFAMHALQGLLSNPHMLQPHPETGRAIGPKTPELAARDAYRFADAMLEARKVRP